MELPLNCLGQDYLTGCGVYNGPDIAELNIKNGELLNSVIQKLSAVSTTVSNASPIDTDQIVSNSLARSGTSPCADQIVDTRFIYYLTSSGGGISLAWDFTNILSNLPANYFLNTSLIRVTGGNDIILNSNDIAGAIPVAANKFPLRLNLEARLDSPCGNILGTLTVDIVNGTDFGMKKVPLNYSDLNPQSGQLSLTEQLNGLESRLQTVEFKSETPSINPEVAVLENRVEVIETTLGNPSDLNVTFSNGNSQFSGTIAQAFEEMQRMIADLTTRLEDAETQLQNNSSNT